MFPDACFGTACEHTTGAADCVVTAQLTYGVRILQANVQGNALQLCSPDTVSRLSGNAAPIIRTPLVTAHTVVATPDADFRTPSGVPLVFPPPTSPDSRVSTPAIAHAVQVKYPCAHPLLLVIVKSVSRCTRLTLHSAVRC